MRKFLIVLTLVMATFLFVGCDGVTPPIPPVENNPPEIISSAITSGKVGVVYNYDVEATDPEEDVLTFSLTEKPLGMSIVATTGIISWTPTDAGLFGIGVKVSDPDGLFDTQSFNITVAKADEPVEPEPITKSETPIITSVPGADDGYVNKVEVEGEPGITIVRGYSIDGSIVKLYFDGKLIGTTIASKAKSGYAIFEFTDLDIDLGEDGEKTLYATAKEYGLAVSDLSDPYIFILDITPPEFELVKIDGKVFEDGDFLFYYATDSCEVVTIEMSEPVELVDEDADAEVNVGIDLFGTFEISEDGLTLTVTPEGGFYDYEAGEKTFVIADGVLQDVAVNENKGTDFTIIFVDLYIPDPLPE